MFGSYKKDGVKYGGQNAMQDLIFKVDDMEARMDDLKDHVEENRLGVDEFEHALDAQAESTDQRLDNIQETLNLVDTRLDILEQQNVDDNAMVNLRKDLDFLVRNCEDLTLNACLDYNRLQEVDNEIIERVGRLETSENDVHDTIQFCELHTRTNTMRLDNIEADHKRALERIEYLEFILRAMGDQLLRNLNEMQQSASVTCTRKKRKTKKH